MFRYTVRVELENVAHDDDVYSILHAYMRKAQFFRRIRDDVTGELYRLPHAEYTYAGPQGIDAVTRLAHAAASHTNHIIRILVTHSDGRRWTGLDLWTNTDEQNDIANEQQFP